ncbi:cell wall-binding repeat-containing protein [Herbiconiux aconitum]|uniref:cell wall-binding repeat-containing protein n=1 Tax=Herbiconiux aconitum TaxID=2970913 RepID=UPI0035564DC1
MLRIEGDDRFIVSANVSAEYYTGPIDTIFVATGANFPDALAGGVLAGTAKSSILLVQKCCVAAEVAAHPGHYSRSASCPWAARTASTPTSSACPSAPRSWRAGGGPS